jgi:hypothetical protein
MTLASKSKAGPQVSGIIRVYSLCTNSEFNHISGFVQSFTLSSLLCHKWNISLNHGPGEENNHINFQSVVADFFFHQTIDCSTQKGRTWIEFSTKGMNNQSEWLRCVEAFIF